MVTQPIISTSGTISAASSVLPHNLDAERAVLGALIFDNRAIDTVVDILDPSSFYHTAHTVIYQSILALYERNRAVDLITLTEELTRRGRLDSVGGAYYLSSLLENVATVSNVQEYAQIVRDKATARRLILAGAEISQLGYNTEEDIHSMVETAEKLIFDIAQQKSRQEFTSLSDLLSSSMEKVESFYQNKKMVTGIPTGYTELDELTSGFQKSDLIIIAGRPSMGKTAFALNIARNLAIDHDPPIPVAIFTLEMSKEQLVLRMLATESRISMRQIQSGLLGEKEFGKLVNSASRLSQAQIFIDETPALSIMELRAKARRLQQKLLQNNQSLGLIIIDYLQMMSGRARAESRQQEVSEISRSLKALAKELHLPVVAISQLSRAPEKRGESRRPQLADLRESGALEQDADLVLFIYRAEFYRRMDGKEIREEDKPAEIIIGKQRNGPCKTVKLAFLEEYTRFENLAKRYDVIPADAYVPTEEL
ncbi:MAG: replicative DNA helicase [bacterium]|nr:replicative DNA helicase [bacterium]